VQRTEQATLRAAEAERALRVHSIERHQAADGHVELNSVFPMVRCYTATLPSVRGTRISDVVRRYA
jgi:hypothetical protein